MNLISLGSGKCSTFGGPTDTGVAENEGLALIGPSDLTINWFRRLFLPAATLSGVNEWDGRLGLARNLNPNALYCAMRWAYGSFGGVQGEILPGYSVDQIRQAIVGVTFNGITAFVQPADWGPNRDTGRLIDLSPGACRAIGASTDSVVDVFAVV